MSQTNDSMNKFNDYEIPEELASKEAQLNPYPHFKNLRDEKPVRYDPNRDVWDVFRYEDVTEVLMNDDGETYTSEGTSHFGKHLLSSDPPEHTSLRNMINDFFKSSYLPKLEPLIQERVDQFLSEAVGDDGRVDWLEDVAIPLPVSIIADLMGIPQSERDRYRRWSENLLRAPAEPTPEAIQQSHQKRIDTRQEMREFFSDIIADRDDDPDPTEDVVSALLVAENNVEWFDRNLTLNACSIVMVGGHITTSTFMSNAMWAYIEHDLFPDLRSGAVDLKDANEEALRYRSPVSRLDRITARPVELGGKEIPEGERLIVWPASANRDERVFDDPDELIPDRDSTKPHIAFGYGVHTCIGNNLARLEGEILFETFLERYGDAELRVDPSELEPFPSTMVNGTDNMPIRVPT